MFFFLEWTGKSNKGLSQQIIPRSDLFYLQLIYFSLHHYAFEVTSENHQRKLTLTEGVWVWRILYCFLWNSFFVSKSIVFLLSSSPRLYFVRRKEMKFVKLILDCMSCGKSVKCMWTGCKMRNENRIKI